ncbi:response regulator [Gimesia sp.]|uniref:response regulator n=1 Tax=Gimesia sp. TaxID=2024833 RepID=UPI003A8D35E5
MTDKVVLIADDDNELSQGLAIRLRGLGYTVMRSPDASHALIGAMRLTPNLIILDVDMPSGNGLAVCEMLNGDERCKGIPVIIHTGHTDTETVQRCHHLGAVYIQKCPGSPATITEIARNLLLLDIQPIAEPVADDQIISETRELNLSCIKSMGKAEAEEFEANETPVAPVSEEALKEEDSAYDVSSEKRAPVVLSIDDDRDLTKSLQMKLKPHGVVCLTAHTGQQGYEMAVEHRPDVIITDLVLPETEGIYIVRRIRSNPSLSEIPVIVLTGQSYPAIKHQILSLGIECFLTKPVTINELIQELQNVITIPSIDSPLAETLSFKKKENKLASMT